MNSYPREPLSPEERELAQFIARVGPHAEPSAALDAKILSAAHAAVAQGAVPATRRPRWPVAMGIAASVVFAVGIAWQLRPLQETAMVTEAPVAASAPLAESEAIEAPAEESVPAPMAAADAMLEQAPVSADAPDTNHTRQASAAEPPAANAAAAQAAPPPPSAPEPKASTALKRPAPVPRQQRADARPPAAAAPPPPVAHADTYLPPSPPAPSAPAPAPAPAPAFAGASAPQVDADMRRSKDASTESATAMAANAAMAREASTAKTRPDLARKAEAARESRVAAAADKGDLDRVEVTGSRLRTDLQVPVAADTRLPVEDWLERVRTRYGLGDAEAARQSLLLFVRDHPKEAVPDDLEPLLDK